MPERTPQAAVIEPEPMPQPKRRVVRIKGKATGMRGVSLHDRANVVAIGEGCYKALELIAKRGLTQKAAAEEAAESIRELGDEQRAPC